MGSHVVDRTSVTQYETVLKHLEQKAFERLQ